MAKHVVVPKITTDPAPIEEVKEQDSGSGKPPSAPLVAVAEEDEPRKPPLQQIIAHMYNVALGGSAVELRNTICRVFPDDKQAALKFMETLQRLRNAGEVIYQTANEAYASLLNR